MIQEVKGFVITTTERRNIMYLGNFENKNDVQQEFQCSDEDMEGVKILLAWYGYGDYDGSAFVLFDRDGKLYEVNGGHCSCYGLEEQWGPEETSVAELRHRLKNGSLGQDAYYGEGVFDKQLKGVLDRWARAHR